MAIVIIIIILLLTSLFQKLFVQDWKGKQNVTQNFYGCLLDIYAGLLHKTLENKRNEVKSLIQVFNFRTHIF